MSRDQFSLTDVREQTYKPRDSWWTVFLVDPFASRLVRWTANHTSITPNQLTIGSFLLGIGSAVCFTQMSWPWLIAGAVLFHLSFVLDCMDGKIARLKGTGTVFGGWLDYVFDRIRVLFCAVALLGAYFAATGQPVFLWVTLLVVVTDMFRYLNSPQMAKVRTKTHARIKRRVRVALPLLGEDELARLLGPRRLEEVRPAPQPEGHPTDGTTDAAADDPADEHGAANPVDHAAEGAAEGAADGAGDDAAGDGAAGDAAGDGAPAAEEPPRPRVGSLADRFPAYARFRAFLDRHRVRPHLFSGIEFHMGAFILAPLVGTVSVTGMLAVMVLSAVGMLAVEFYLIIRLWQLTRRYEREKALLDGAIAAATAMDSAPDSEPATAAEARV